MGGKHRRYPSPHLDERSSRDVWLPALKRLIEEAGASWVRAHPSSALVRVRNQLARDNPEQTLVIPRSYFVATLCELLGADSCEHGARANGSPTELALWSTWGTV